MLCDKCKTKPIAKGIKQLHCFACGEVKTVNCESTKKHCNNCSDKFGECSLCGEIILKENKIMFKIGQKWKVREDLVAYKEYGEKGVVEEMLGKEYIEVCELHGRCHNSFYDEENWCWTKEMLECLVEDVDTNSTNKEHNCKCNQISTIKLNCTFEGENFPKYESSKASGMDLSAWKYREPYYNKVLDKYDLLPAQEFSEDGYILGSLERVLIPTGLKIQFTDGVDAEVRPRSGLSIKQGLVAIQGTIDEDYTGDIGVMLVNLSKDDIVIHKGDRVGQIVFSEKVELIRTNSLNETERGENGFGSSGIK